MQDVTTIICPYCGEPNEIYIDYSGGELQQYIEDCQVCCQPWQVRVEIVDDEPVVTVSTGDD
jgi:hypothetical protein